MLEYSSSKYGKWRRVDIEALWIGDNLASEMSQQQIYSELTRIKSVDQFRRLDTFGLNSTKEEPLPARIEAPIRRRAGLVQGLLRLTTISPNRRLV